ncbi:hypothetical protein I4U23_011305 [Adineta vaga]|nr:hypothetical protein I4U23_011305 [Adineta vaga]
MVIKILIIFSIFICDVSSLQAGDFYVKSLPLLPETESFIHMHAGYLPVNSQNDGSLFFWHFAKKFKGDQARTVIWLNGGPGQSSLIGAWTEIGPFRFSHENTIVLNDGSWHYYVNLLFIDQPIGTGFSYADGDQFIKDLDKMAEHFLGFLDRYVEIFPEFLQQDIYLAGESFAGQYIPYIAKAILEKRSSFRLRGLLIGNGWIDPVSIYNSYLPFSIANNLVKNGSELYTDLIHKVDTCQQILSKQVHIFVLACYSIAKKIMDEGIMSQGNVRKTKGSCINAYDIRLTARQSYCGTKGPSELEYVSAYLNRKDVMSCIHANGKKSGWKDFSEPVKNALETTNSKPSINLLPDLLRRIPIVLYSGEYDLICNHLGTEKMLDKMTWNDGTGFDLGNNRMAPTNPWIVDNESAGLIRSARNLTYILFYNAGHMVPYNQARRSRAMLHQFIQLNLTSTNSQTTENYPKMITQSMYGNNLKSVISIIIVIIIIIVILIGITWLSVGKRQKWTVIMPYQCPTLFQSTQESVAYSVISNSNINDECATIEDDVL